MDKPIIVSAAILVFKQSPTINLICLAQRNDTSSHSGWWEFPGGKVEQNETPAEAITRELHEELGITVTNPNWLCAEHLDNLEIHFFKIDIDHIVTTSKAHNQLRWLNKIQLKSFFDDQNAHKILSADISVLKKVINGAINLTS